VPNEVEVDGPEPRRSGQLPEAVAVQLRPNGLPELIHQDQTSVRVSGAQDEPVSGLAAFSERSSAPVPRWISSTGTVLRLAVDFG
jgi:hypothetical protein